jgi:hypothetical protein
MTTMRNPSVVPLPTDRARRLRLVTAARQRLVAERGRGRAWINGREVGGTDQRFAHLARTYD